MFKRGVGSDILNEICSWIPVYTCLPQAGGNDREGKKERSVETREAILDLQYSEKMKSGLIIGAGLLDQLVSLRDEEQSGGRKSWYGI